MALLPVKIGDVIVADVAGTGADLIATANMA
jgi:CxxC motif-containing protein